MDHRSAIIRREIRVFDNLRYVSGLFQQAIAMSGTAVSYTNTRLKSNQNVSEELTKLVGCERASKREAIECLRNQSGQAVFTLV